MRGRERAILKITWGENQGTIDEDRGKDFKRSGAEKEADRARHGSTKRWL